MARTPVYIPPFKLKPVHQPSDTRLGEVPEFRLDASELQMWDVFAQEPIHAAGTDCELFTRNLQKSKIDPLYSEPAETVFDGPYLIRANIEWPEFTPEVSEEGMRGVWPSGAWIPRKTIEDVRARAPREGDILRFWKLPYFDERASNDQHLTYAGYYFDVIKVNDDGHLHNTSAFVGFRCDLKRKSSFGAEEQFFKALKMPPVPPTVLGEKDGEP
jgi:hypothetical protein